MASNGTESLPFKDYKSVLLDYDFGYFFGLDLKEKDYAEKNIQDVYLAHEQTLNQLNQKGQKNKKQFRLYLEGQVHLMFADGLLTSLFRMDGWTRSADILDFRGIGKDWAYFEAWQKLERKYQQKKKVWDIIVKVGAVLAYLLAILRIIAFFTKQP